MNRVLFVCMGNICRSPAAHCVFQHLVDEAGLGEEFEIDSAGTIGYHAGSPPDARMAEVLQRKGYPVFGHSRALRAEDLERYDLILVMDRDNLADARRLDEESRFTDRIRLFSEFLGDGAVADVPDPYYDGDRGFVTVLKMIEEGCAALLAWFRERR